MSQPADGSKGDPVPRNPALIRNLLAVDWLRGQRRVFTTGGKHKTVQWVLFKTACTANMGFMLDPSPRREPPPSRFAESYRFGLCFSFAFHMTPFLILRMWPQAWVVLQLAVLVSGGLFCVIMKLSGASRVAAGAATAFLLCLTLYIVTLAAMFL